MRTSLLFIFYVNISYCLKSRVWYFYRICFCIKTRTCACLCVCVCVCVNENRAPRKVCSRWQHPYASPLLPHPFSRLCVLTWTSLRPEQWQCDSFSVLEPLGKQQPSAAELHEGASVKPKYKALHVCSPKPGTLTARVLPKPSGDLGGRTERNVISSKPLDV